MIKQVFYVESYWKVIVYYNMDYNFFDDVLSVIPKKIARRIYSMMVSGKAKAVTYSDTREHISIVIFNYHYSESDYINSIVHEAEHVKQAMLEAYKVMDAGEPSAYTIGYLVMRMYEVIKFLICDCT